jgi:hypothetical protein
MVMRLVFDEVECMAALSNRSESNVTADSVADVATENVAELYARHVGESVANQATLSRRWVLRLAAVATSAATQVLGVV